MQTYQLNYLIPEMLESEELQKTALNIESLIQAEEGILIGQRKTKNVNLSPAIRRTKKATLITIEFQSDSRNLKALKIGLEKTPQLLRFMLLKQTPKKESKKARKPKIAKVKKEKKVGIKEIEKKLEQILNEPQ